MNRKLFRKRLIVLSLTVNPGVCAGAAEATESDCSRDRAAAYARDPARDFDTLEAAGNDHPRGLWSDGVTMWVADTDDEKIFAYNLMTKARDPAKDFNTLRLAGNIAPRGIWSDGVTMWVAHTGGWKWELLASDDDKIFAYNLATKARDPVRDFNTLEAAGNTSPKDIWSDGETLWVADTDLDLILAYNLSTKARDPARDFDTVAASGNTSPRGLWSDGVTMWVGDYSDDKLYAYDMTTKARDPAKDFDTLAAAGNTSPRGLWSDGATLWVADYGDEKLYAYNMPSNGASADADFPGAPSIQSVMSGSGSLTVTWSAPSSDGGSAITAYDLRYVPSDAPSKADAEWTVVQDVWTAGSGVLSYELTGLTDGTQYDVQVGAVNGACEGPWSATATGTTTTATGGGAPTDFNGDGRTDFADFFLFIDAFGTTDARYDLDGNGTVDFVDFFRFIDAFDPSGQAKLVALAREMLGLPVGSELHQNAPNPFNSETVISWFLAEPGPARVEVFSLTGQRLAVLRQGPQQAGYHRLHWNGRDDEGRPLASGVYLYRLVTAEGVLTRKLTLLR